jgi:hypothetical protein
MTEPPLFEPGAGHENVLQAENADQSKIDKHS